MSVGPLKSYFEVDKVWPKDIIGCVQNPVQGHQ